MAVAYCPRCRKPQILTVKKSTNIRKDGTKEKKIITLTYNCESCRAFVRSEEVSPAK